MELPLLMAMLEALYITAAHYNQQSSHPCAHRTTETQRTDRSGYPPILTAQSILPMMH